MLYTLWSLDDGPLGESEQIYEGLVGHPHSLVCDMCQLHRGSRLAPST